MVYCVVRQQQKKVYLFNCQHCNAFYHCWTLSEKAACALTLYSLHTACVQSEIDGHVHAAPLIWDNRLFVHRETAKPSGSEI